MTHTYRVTVTPTQLELMPPDVSNRIMDSLGEALEACALDRLAKASCTAGYRTVTTAGGPQGVECVFTSGLHCGHVVDRTLELGDLAVYMPLPPPVDAPAQTANDVHLQEYRNLRSTYADALAEQQQARIQLDAANLRMMEARAQVDIAQVALTEHATAQPDV